MSKNIKLLQARCVSHAQIAPKLVFGQHYTPNPVGGAYGTPHTLSWLVVRTLWRLVNINPSYGLVLHFHSHFTQCPSLVVVSIQILIFALLFRTLHVVDFALSQWLRYRQDGTVASSAMVLSIIYVVIYAILSM